jgi:putative phosphoesterase
MPCIPEGPSAGRGSSSTRCPSRPSAEAGSAYPAAIRLAVLTDVHANLPALQAVLRAIGEARCDAVVHTGDAIGIGPHPAECLDLLLASGAELVLGNHDAYFAFGVGDRPYDAEGLAHHRWTHEQLDPALREVVGAWPLELTKTVAGQSLLLIHYGRDASWFVPPPKPGTATSVAGLDVVFADATADVVFYGHDHLAFDGTGARRYVNPGSVGCFTRAEARYAIVDDDGIQHRAVPYDDRSVFADLVAREVPLRDEICRAFLPRG